MAADLLGSRHQKPSRSRCPVAAPACALKPSAEAALAAAAPVSWSPGRSVLHLVAAAPRRRFGFRWQLGADAHPSARGARHRERVGAPTRARAEPAASTLSATSLGSRRHEADRDRLDLVARGWGRQGAARTAPATRSAGMPWLTRYWVAAPNPEQGSSQASTSSPCTSAARSTTPSTCPEPSMRYRAGRPRWAARTRRRWRPDRALVRSIEVGQGRAVREAERAAVRARQLVARPGSTAGSDGGPRFGVLLLLKRRRLISRPRSPARCQPTAANARLSANASPSAALANATSGRPRPPVKCWARIAGRSRSGALAHGTGRPGRLASTPGLPPGQRNRSCGSRKVRYASGASCSRSSLPSPPPKSGATASRARGTRP